MRNLIVVIAAALLTACASVPNSALDQPSSGPVLDLDFPDPFILPAGRDLFAYATNTTRDGRLLHVQVSRSPDGRTWTTPADAMPAPPRWVLAPDGDIWAPEVIQIGERYVLYFAARHKQLRREDGLTLCIGVAVASSPQGPFQPRDEPLTCGGPDGVIDPSPFRDGADLWLYVKTDGNCCHRPVGFQALRLSPDGLGVVGDPVPLAGISSDSKWEGDVVEAPEMARHDGRYWMFFSGNDYGGDDYGIGYARCEGPTGPCRQAAENPILKSGAGVFGPGHEAVFEAGGRSYLAFHAWRSPAGQPRYRALYIAPIGWSETGPRVQTIIPPSVPHDKSTAP